ncbi:hypothetical protein ACWFPY_05640 [Nocardia fluminea]
MPADDLSRHHGAAWLHKPDSPEPHSGDPQRVDPYVDSQAGQHNRGPAHRFRIVAISAAVLSVVTGLAAALAVSMSGESRDRADTSPTTSAPPTGATTTSVVVATERACAGVTAQIVTAGAGDTATVAGVIAAFEHAYYVTRSAEQVLRLASPQAGLAHEPLAAAITALPIGTTHCVGVTSIAENTAEVHLVELHPDGRRFDYLQVINVSAVEPAGLVITNIQKRGS